MLSDRRSFRRSSQKSLQDRQHGRKQEEVLAILAPATERSKPQVDCLTSLLLKVAELQLVSLEIVRELAQAIHGQALQPQEQVYREHDIAEDLYILASGRVLLQRGAEAGSIKDDVPEDEEVFPYQMFGSIEQASHLCRTETAVAVQPSLVMKVSYSEYQRMLSGHRSKIMEDKVDFLASLNYLKELSRSYLFGIANSFCCRVFNPRDVVVRQGDPADSLYCVREGQCCVLIDPDIKNSQDPTAAPGANETEGEGEGESMELDLKRLVQVCIVGPGTVLGDMAVIQSAPRRSASVVALTAMRAYHISMDAFKRRMPEEILMRMKQMAEHKVKVNDIQLNSRQEGMHNKGLDVSVVLGDTTVPGKVLRGYGLRALHLSHFHLSLADVRDLIMVSAGALRHLQEEEQHKDGPASEDQDLMPRAQENPSGSSLKNTSSLDKFKPPHRQVSPHRDLSPPIRLGTNLQPLQRTSPSNQIFNAKSSAGPSLVKNPSPPLRLSNSLPVQHRPARSAVSDPSPFLPLSMISPLVAEVSSIPDGMEDPGVQSAGGAPSRGAFLRGEMDECLVPMEAFRAISHHHLRLDADADASIATRSAPVSPIDRWGSPTRSTDHHQGEPEAGEDMDQGDHASRLGHLQQAPAASTPEYEEEDLSAAICTLVGGRTMYQPQQTTELVTLDSGDCPVVSISRQQPVTAKSIEVGLMSLHRDTTRSSYCLNICASPQPGPRVSSPPPLLRSGKPMVPTLVLTPAVAAEVGSPRATSARLGRQGLQKASRASGDCSSNSEYGGLKVSGQSFSLSSSPRSSLA